MINTLCQIVVLLTGLYFVGLAAMSLATPARATQFLLSFARSAFAHYTELLLRLVVGGAFLLRAPHMPFTKIFAFFGWILVITTAFLFAVPWQWHHRIAERAVPFAIRNLQLLAVASLVAGGFVLGSMLSGSVT